MFARAGRMLSAKGAETGWRDDYGTGLRDTAAVLALAAQAGSNAVNLESTGKALAARLAAVPLSTQEAAPDADGGECADRPARCRRADGGQHAD